MALADKNYSELPLLKRLGLLLHVKLCPFCGKFNRQLIQSQEMFDHFKDRETTGLHQQHSMQPDSKQQLKERLNKVLQTHAGPKEL